MDFQDVALICENRIRSSSEYASIPHKRGSENYKLRALSIAESYRDEVFEVIKQHWDAYESKELGVSRFGQDFALSSEFENFDALSDEERVTLRAQHSAWGRVMEKIVINIREAP